MREPKQTQHYYLTLIYRLRKNRTPTPTPPPPKHLDFLTVLEITDAAAAARFFSCPQNASRLEILLGLNIYRI